MADISEDRRPERTDFVPEEMRPHLKANDFRSLRRRVLGILRAIHGFAWSWEVKCWACGQLRDATRPRLICKADRFRKGIRSAHSQRTFMDYLLNSKKPTAIAIQSLGYIKLFKIRINPFLKICFQSVVSITSYLLESLGKFVVLAFKVL
jgi:hypothetical protein